MYLHEYLATYLPYLAAIVLGIYILVLVLTMLTFLFSVAYVGLKKFFPKTYKLLRLILLRY